MGIASTIALMVIAALGGVPHGEPAMFEALDTVGIRYWNACGGLCAIGGGEGGGSIDWSSNPPYTPEDRTAVLFDLTDLTAPEQVIHATLDLGMQDQDPGPPVVGVVDIFIEGTDVNEIPLEAFFAGEYRRSFEFDEINEMIHVDVTELIQEATEWAEPNLLFRLSTVTTDRFLLGPVVGHPYPTLTITLGEIEPVSGDFDGDGDVDLRDAARFGQCFTGPDGAIEPDCNPGDFNADGAIDLTDLAQFIETATGPS